VVIAFGYCTLGSILTLFQSNPVAPISNRELQWLLVVECLTIVVLGTFLFIRGWNLEKLGLVPSWRDTGIGLLLAVCTYFVDVVVFAIVSLVSPSLETNVDSLVSSSLDVSTVVAVALLNPVFEEVFVCGYLITALRRTRSVSFAVNVSVALRLAYHLYQGPFGAITIIPFGLIFACWFARTGRLWPLVIAHGFFDLGGLLAYVRQ
jgi:membrane protease YdiL (CAAX protease family)